MLSRRSLLRRSLQTPVSASLAFAPPALPDKANFRVQEFETCLNAARWHPLSNGARAAADLYQEYKQRGIWDRGSLWSPSNPSSHGGSQIQTKELFAKLIHSSADEVAFVPSTTAGENLVVQSLGLPAGGGNIVTDGLHFEGSLYLYDSLRKGGMDVRIVKPRHWRIEMDDLERVIDSKTRLVALSAVSYINGFQHDLKRVCEIAHAKGALVFADIVQAAGAIPVDVKASGVDFCAAASYKWLMGDFGLGFLYVKKSLLGERVNRPVHSYRQLSAFSNHMFPYDSPSDSMVEWRRQETAAGYFEQGTIASGVSETLAYSLQYIQSLGVENIQRHSQKLMARLRVELPRLGHELITPEDSAGPIVAFQLKDPSEVEARVKKARIDVTITDHRLRVSPSVYNDDGDIDRLIGALTA